jgi:predicted dehydrogenase
MGKKLKLGWVGSGFIGQVAHLANYVELPNVEIIGLAELRPKLGELVCRKYGISRYYPDHRALLEDPDIEAVVAIVRRKHTAPVALDILNRGFHLFTEKPMAPSVDQGRKLVEASIKNHCNYVTGYMRRHDEGVQVAKRTLDELRRSGELGGVLYFRSYCFGGKDYCNISGYIKTDEPPPDHRIWPMAPHWLPEDMEDEYERFLNVFIHDINIIRYLFDSLPAIKNVDYHKTAGTLVLEYNDFPGVFEYGQLETNRFWAEGVDVYFEHGRLQLKLPPAFLINYPATVVIHKDKPGKSIETLSPQTDWTWSFMKQAQSFVDIVLSGNKSIANAVDALQDIEFVESVWKKII